MAADDVTTKARELPRGAVFHRCALQVNPHHYDSTYRGNAPSGDAVDHAGAIVQKASDLRVSVLAITDHNHVGGVAAFRNAAEGHGIHIFPGFELSSSEGIHVLCHPSTHQPPRTPPGADPSMPPTQLTTSSRATSAGSA